MILDVLQRILLAVLGVIALALATDEARVTAGVVMRLVEFLVGIVLLVVAVLGVFPT